MQLFIPRPQIFLFLVAVIGLYWLNSIYDLHSPALAFEHPLVFIFYALVLGISITGVLGFFSGWPILASKFMAKTRPTGKEIKGGVSRIGLVPEGNVTRLIPTNDGLYLRTVWPFQLFRPLLIIPWHEIRDIKERKIFFLRSYLLQTSAHVEVVVSKKAFEAIDPFWRLGKSGIVKMES